MRLCKYVHQAPSLLCLFYDLARSSDATFLPSVNSAAVVDIFYSFPSFAEIYKLNLRAHAPKATQFLTEKKNNKKEKKRSRPRLGVLCQEVLCFLSPLEQSNFVRRGEGNWHIYIYKYIHMRSVCAQNMYKHDLSNPLWRFVNKVIAKHLEHLLFVSEPSSPMSRHLAQNICRSEKVFFASVLARGAVHAALNLKVSSRGSFIRCHELLQKSEHRRHCCIPESRHEAAQVSIEAGGKLLEINKCSKTSKIAIPFTLHDSRWISKCPF